MRNNAALIMLTLAGAIAAGGCQSSNSISGHAVTGTASLVTLVDKNDPRLIQPGVPACHVALAARFPRSGDSPIGGADTDANGAFTIRTGRVSGMAQVVVEGVAEGCLPAGGVLYPPTRDQRVLVVLRRLDHAPPIAPPPAPAPAKN